LKKKVDLYKL